MSRRVAVVIGWPVQHSKSPVMHNAGFAALGINAEYSALAVTPSDLASAVAGLREQGALGASITVPHKTAVMQHCDTLSDAAQAIGAANTLEFRDDGSICGHNTDAVGYVRALRDATGEDPSGRKVVLLGGGGAARAVAHGLTEAGASQLRVIVRTPGKVTWTQAELWETAVLEGALHDCELLVDCTSMGLDEESEAKIPAPVPLECMPRTAIVSTLVYHRQTTLLAEAASAGLATVDGSGMLLFQGAVAFEIWTGQVAPIEAMRAALL